ncbi:MAG: fluoride efflux transporter CrcB [Bacteroidetes bacterium]|jgi:CrcB protein|nr:fluoride efflux transporter CrcB [Bacteroidota bacterium]
MTELITVCAGGAIGAALRYLTGIITRRVFKNASIYTGTLAANILGCFLAGILLALSAVSLPLPEHAVLFLTTGMVGAYTTFSTFALESARLFSGPLDDLLIYLFWQIAAAFTAVWAGFQLYSTVFWGGV